jgi:hypothetical protein
MLVLIVCAACGRLGFDDGTTTAPTLPPTDPVDTHKTPQVCGSQTWSVAAASDDDLSIAVTPTNVAMFSAPASGGNLHGAITDHVGNLTGSGVVRTGPFTASAAAYVDSTLIAAVVSSSRVLVNIVPETLDNYAEIANVDGQYVSKQALMHASADRISPTACSAGLTVNPFTLAWQAATSELASVTDQSIGIAATPIDDEALVVWSTMTECHVERVMNESTGVPSKQSWKCAAPRLAYDATMTLATVLFEETDGVRLASIQNDTLTSSSLLLVPGAQSPRILNDGARTWVAFLDSTGMLQVGTFGSDGNIVSVATNLHPGHDAFELAIVDGKLWAYAINAGTYTATNICLI